jgi:hypothetical protein
MIRTTRSDRGPGEDAALAPFQIPRSVCAHPARFRWFLVGGCLFMVSKTFRESTVKPWLIVRSMPSLTFDYLPQMRAPAAGQAADLASEVGEPAT